MTSNNKEEEEAATFVLLIVLDGSETKEQGKRATRIPVNGARKPPVPAAQHSKCLHVATRSTRRYGSDDLFAGRASQGSLEDGLVGNRCVHKHRLAICLLR